MDMHTILRGKGERERQETAETAETSRKSRAPLSLSLSRSRGAGGPSLEKGHDDGTCLLRTEDCLLTVLVVLCSLCKGLMLKCAPCANHLQLSHLSGGGCHYDMDWDGMGCCRHWREEGTCE